MSDPTTTISTTLPSTSFPTILDFAGSPSHSTFVATSHSSFPNFYDESQPPVALAPLAGRTGSSNSLTTTASGSSAITSPLDGFSPSFLGHGKDGSGGTAYTEPEEIIKLSPAMMTVEEQEFIDQVLVNDDDGEEEEAVLAFSGVEQERPATVGLGLREYKIGTGSMEMEVDKDEAPFCTEQPNIKRGEMGATNLWTRTMIPLDESRAPSGNGQDASTRDTKDAEATKSDEEMNITDSKCMNTTGSRCIRRTDDDKMTGDRLNPALDASTIRILDSDLDAQITQFIQQGQRESLLQQQTQSSLVACTTTSFLSSTTTKSNTVDSFSSQSKYPPPPKDIQMDEEYEQPVSASASPSRSAFVSVNGCPQDVQQQQCTLPLSGTFQGYSQAFFSTSTSSSSLHMYTSQHSHNKQDAGSASGTQLETPFASTSAIDDPSHHPEKDNFSSWSPSHGILPPPILTTQPAEKTSNPAPDEMHGSKDENLLEYFRHLNSQFEGPPASGISSIEATGSPTSATFRERSTTLVPPSFQKTREPSPQLLPSAFERAIKPLPRSSLTRVKAADLRTASNPLAKDLTVVPLVTSPGPGLGPSPMELAGSTKPDRTVSSPTASTSTPRPVQRITVQRSTDSPGHTIPIAASHSSPSLHAHGSSHRHRGTPSQRRRGSVVASLSASPGILPAPTSTNPDRGPEMPPSPDMTPLQRHQQESEQMWRERMRDKHGNHGYHRRNSQTFPPTTDPDETPKQRSRREALAQKQAEAPDLPQPPPQQHLRRSPRRHRVNDLIGPERTNRSKETGRFDPGELTPTSIQGHRPKLRTFRSDIATAQASSFDMLPPPPASGHSRRHSVSSSISSNPLKPTKSNRPIVDPGYRSSSTKRRTSMGSPTGGTLPSSSVSTTTMSLFSPSVSAPVSPLDPDSISPSTSASPSHLHFHPHPTDSPSIDELEKIFASLQTISTFLAAPPPLESLPDDGSAAESFASPQACADVDHLKSRVGMALAAAGVTVR